MNFKHHNEQYNSEYDWSDDNYVAMIEHINHTPIGLQNITITIGNIDCHFLLDSGWGCTIMNISISEQIRFNCFQAQWSEKKTTQT